MEKQFCTYQISLKLKELGFNDECFWSYCKKSLDTNEWILYKGVDEFYLPAPLWQQATEWLREKHNIDIWVEHYSPSERYFYQCPQLNDAYSKLNHWGDTYEQALGNGLLEALKLIINK